MKKIFKISALLMTLLILSSCNSSPQTIDYGNDGCHYCKMTIVDKIHASQLVTDKGKVFKFDATECMVNYLEDDTEIQVGSLHSNYYEEPTAFIAVEEATFLISKNLPSPMGANLTAFKNKEEAEKMLAEKGGELYTWDALKTHLKQ